MAKQSDWDGMTVSIAQCAEALGISETGVRRHIEDQGWPAIRIGRRVLILKQGILDFVLRQTGDPGILAEDAATAKAQALDDKLGAKHRAEERAAWDAMQAAHVKAHGITPNPIGVRQA